MNQMKTPNNKPYFAEIIESSLQSWRAQSWQWDTFPPFGSLVAVQGAYQTLFGIVHQVETGSMDPGRYPFPYQKTEEELLREQPQIFEFLRTSFVCLTAGYQEHNKPIVYQLAPQPPKIHAFVRMATSEELTAFFAQRHYLHLIFNFSHQILNLDELLLALLKQQSETKLLSTAQLHQFIDTFSLLTGNDYRRLKIFLQRAQPLIKLAE